MPIVSDADSPTAYLSAVGRKGANGKMLGLLIKRWDELTEAQLERLVDEMAARASGLTPDQRSRLRAALEEVESVSSASGSPLG